LFLLHDAVISAVATRIIMGLFIVFVVTVVWFLIRVQRIVYTKEVELMARFYNDPIK
jgi:hypothetical protein